VSLAKEPGSQDHDHWKLGLAAGIIYYVEPAKSLPTFFPGHLAHGNGRHTTRGLAGIVAGAVLLIIAVITARAGRRWPSRNNGAKSTGTL